jgi:hypothetical protein
MHDHFAVSVTNNRLWEFLIPRRSSNRVQDRGVHASSSLDPMIQQILPAERPGGMSNGTAELRNCEIAEGAN